MTLVVDAGALYAQADTRDRDHERVVEVRRAERGALVTSQVAAAEADCLIPTPLGVDVALAILEDLAEQQEPVRIDGTPSSLARATRPRLTAVTAPRDHEYGV